MVLMRKERPKEGTYLTKIIMKPSPLTLSLWKNCLPHNWSLVQKGWGMLPYRFILRNKMSGYL